MARLTCRAAAKETPRITWFKTDQSGSLVGKVDSANVLVSGDLRINSAKRSDRSYYVCRACNAAGCVTTLPVMLNVLCKYKRDIYSRSHVLYLNLSL